MARGRELVDARALSREELDLRQAELEQAHADVAARDAEVQRATLDVEFTRVVAPIAGRAGEARVTAGNLVDAEVVLASVVAMDPLDAEFDVDERTFLANATLRSRLAAGAATNGAPAPADGGAPAAVVIVPGGDGTTHERAGVLHFVDSGFEAGSGTLRVQVRLANADRRFAPGQTARVLLPRAAPRPLLLIHERALLTDQDRQYVWVVDAGGAAARRDLVLGGLVDGLRIVHAGLAAAERVVVEGQQRIFFPGMPLAPVEVQMLPDPAARQGVGTAAGAEATTRD
jgi:multidrug efflux system membrane fusion protein